LSLRLHESMAEHDASMMNGLQLAFMGDAVWSVIVREELIARKYNVHHMHTESIRFVSAKSQAAALERITPVLSGPEAEIVRRGRNAHSHHPVPKHQNPEDYAAATGFEALIGYLYLTGKEDRVLELAGMIIGG